MKNNATDSLARISMALLAALMTIAGCSSSTVTEPGTGGTGGSGADGGTGGGGGTTSSSCDWQAEFSSFFSQDHVVSISIDFDDPNAWNSMVANKMAKEFYSATVTIDGESMTQVGVRFKGNSSLQMSEPFNTKSFKVHFEQYVDGQRFHCVDRMSLNNSTKDPSMMRERLSYALAEEAGLAAPRTAYAEVTVDGDLHGVFVMVQQVDKRFLKDRYGTADSADDGNLYKLYSDYDFSYLGPDATPSDYGDAVVETGLVLKTNEDDPALNDYSDVTELTQAIDAVLQDPSEANRVALEAVLDVESLLRYQAWTLIISNLDVYYTMQHNLYVYHHPVTDRFVAIPWDLNESFGAFACMGGGPGQPGDDVTTVDLLRPCGAQRPLNRLSYEVPEYQAQYCQYLHELVDVANTAAGALYNVAGQDSQIAALHALVAEARQRMDDYGVLTQPPGEYSYQDFVTNQGHSSISPGGGSGPGAGPNLGYFNDQRLASLQSQIVGLCGN